MFRSSPFSFLVLVTFRDEVMKIQKYYVIFVYILQGKMGKAENNGKENQATKVTKIPKDENMEWTKLSQHKHFLAFQSLTFNTNNSFT